MTKHLPILVSHSSMDTGQRCPRKFKHRYIDLRKPKGHKSGALELGSNWDDWLERQLRGDEELVSYNWAPGREVERAHFHAMTVAAKQAGVLDWLLKEGTLHDTQYAFEVPLVHPRTNAEYPGVALQGFMDAVWEDEYGQVWIVEVKTTSANTIADNSQYWREKRVSPQGALYHYAGVLMGMDPVGIKWVVARKPKLKPRMSESMDSYAKRMVLEMVADTRSYFRVKEQRFVKFERDAAVMDMWQSQELLDFAVQRGLYPRHTHNCNAFFKRCEYYAACWQGADIGDEDLYEDRGGRGIPSDECNRTWSPAAPVRAHGTQAGPDT